MAVDWQAGTAAASLTANVNIEAIIVGTPDSVFGIFAVKSQMRNGDYVGVIPGRSTIGLPYSAPGFVPNVNQQILSPSRNGTLMLDLGDTTYGFCDDTIAQEAEAVDIGEVRFNIDTANLNFLTNAVKVYDEGFSPRKRVLSRYHEFQGNLAMESELYRIVCDPVASLVRMYNYTAPGVYAGSPFESFTFLGMNGFNLVLNKDEICRVHLNSGDYIELERGKDPVVRLSELGSSGGFYYTLAASQSLATTSTDNYVNIAPQVYLCSNYEFEVLTNKNVRTKTPLTPPTDQVFSIVYYTGSFATDGRNREVLKEIS
jgi:hypothetical protein